MTYRHKVYMLLSTLIFTLSDAAANSFILPVPYGEINRAFIEYKDADTITVSSGYGECSGFYWENITPIDIDLTVPTVEDVIYIFVDYSASSFPTVTFASSTTEPSWSDTKQGWYNGDDRCVGAVLSDSTSGTIKSFRNFGTKLVFDTGYTIANNLTPTGSWATTTTDTDDITPVMAKSLRASVWGWDTGDWVQAMLGTYDSPGAHQVGGIGWGRTGQWSAWIDTGTYDRTLQIKGDAGDESKLSARLEGWDISR